MAKETDKSAKPRVRSVCVGGFKKQLRELGESVSALAEDKYQNYFLTDPHHTALQGKWIHDKIKGLRVWSVSINYRVRALALVESKDGYTCYIWYWVGTHEQYNNRT